MKETLVLNYIVYAQPGEVFKALTDSTEIQKWSKSKGIVSAHPGGVFEYFDGWVKGEVLEINPPSSLIITWKPSEWDKKTPASQVKIAINRHNAGSLITLEHSCFPNKHELEKHQSGWIDYVFEPLNEFFTT